MTDEEIIAAALMQMMPGHPYSTATLIAAIGLTADDAPRLEGLLRAQPNIRRSGMAWYKA